MPATTAVGFRQPRWINTQRRWLRGLESAMRTCPQSFRIWRISRPTTWDSWAEQFPNEFVRGREHAQGKRLTGNGEPLSFSGGNSRLARTYLGSLVIARNTRSSTATVGVNTVALFPLAKAICLARPLSAGPAGLELFCWPSPRSREMRVVLGVQLATPVQVSRTKTWRRPLLAALFATAAAFAPAVRCAACVSGEGVIATNATNLPLELTEGRMLSVRASAP